MSAALLLALLAAPQDSEAARRAIVARCGIAADRLAIEPRPDWPNESLVLKGDALLSDRKISCFATVLAESDVVSFEIENPAIGERYEVLRVRSEAVRKRSMRRIARADLAARGLLRRVPRYASDRESLQDFARRLEALCGAPPGTALTTEGGVIGIVANAMEEGSPAGADHAFCAINAAFVAGFDPFEIPPVPLPVVTTPVS